MEAKMKKRKALLKLLIDKGITQTELAKRVGISFQSVNRWMTGKSNPSYVYIPKIAEALNIPEKEVIACFKSEE